jgi:hypothetical protein
MFVGNMRMKPLTPLELCGLALGAVFFFVGLAAVIWPRPGVIPHFTNGFFGRSPRFEMEVITPTGGRFYGVLAMLLGAGMVAFVLYRPKRLLLVGQTNEEH